MILVVGAGVFGVTAALALRRRGRAVTLLDPGPLPHPLAASTDLSKVVRVDYGDDETYTALAERALEGFRAWNASLSRPLFHETGALFLTRAPMRPGGFEHDSHALLTRRGHALERMDVAALRARFPAFGAGDFVDGYYNPHGGWVESGALVAELARVAGDEGVALAIGARAREIVVAGGRARGVMLTDGRTLAADAVVVTGGAWTPSLLPRLAPLLRPVGQPVFHLAPAELAAFDARTFPVFGADIAVTGYYGFPATSGVVKIANHGPGREMHPESPEREVTDEETRELRAFLANALPVLASAPIARTRVCLYCDTSDHHFLIDEDPEHRGLVVAAGGSGHAFKFAPLLGGWIADALDGVTVPRFAWRVDRGPRGEERTRRNA